MGLFKSFIDKITKGFFYVVDLNTFRTYLERELKFSVEENFEFCTELNIYHNEEKHFMQMYNNLADEENPREGVTVVYDKKEYDSIESFIREALAYLPEFFKIELTLSDDVCLNKYKESHPELDPEDY